MQLGRNGAGLEGEFDEPLLEEAVGAELVTVELVTSGPRDEEARSGEEDEAPRFGEGKSVLCPADKEGLREEVSEEKAKGDDDNELPSKSGEGLAAKLGEGKEKGPEGEDDEPGISPRELEGHRMALGLELRKAAFHTLGDSPRGVGRAGDALGCFAEADNFTNRHAVVEI